MPRYLTVLPVYNESQHITSVLDQVAKYAADVLVVDDGSEDGSSELLAQRNDINVVFHPKNRGYGAALLTAFDDRPSLRHRRHDRLRRTTRASANCPARRRLCTGRYRLGKPLSQPADTDEPSRHRRA